MVCTLQTRSAWGSKRKWRRRRRFNSKWAESPALAYWDLRHFFCIHCACDVDFFRPQTTTEWVFVFFAWYGLGSVWCELTFFHSLPEFTIRPLNDTASRSVDGHDVPSWKLISILFLHVKFLSCWNFLKICSEYLLGRNIFGFWSLQIQSIILCWNYLPTASEKILVTLNVEASDYHWMSIHLFFPNRA